MKGKQLIIALTGALALLLALASTAAAKTQTKSAPLPANFVRYVTNPYFPLKPGTTFYYEGETEGVPATDTMTVLSTTKTILGVTCTVVRDQAFENGVLIEDTLDWYAQDKDGNVWYFGEDTKELDANGNVT